MSDYGRLMLEKYGWKEGKGLGREEDGMSKPIKVKGNFNSYGMGHDAGKEYKSQWWDHVYNKTANNIIVGKSEDGSVQLERKDEVRINQKVVPFVSSSSSQYSSFVKGGNLSDEEEEKDMSLKLSDEELFKICGGRTAHKGARHGIKMSAKLDRIEKQEQELLEKWKNTSNRSSQDVETAELTHKNWKKSTSNIKDVSECEASLLGKSGDEELPADCEHISKKEKKKKRKNNAEKELVLEDQQTKFSNGGECNENTVEIASEVFEPKLSKKERKLLHEREDAIRTASHVDDADEIEGTHLKKTKKHKKRRKVHEKENAEEMEVLSFESEMVEKKKYKKKKEEKGESAGSNYEDNSVSVDTEFTEPTNEYHKKKKKKHKH